MTFARFSTRLATPFVWLLWKLGIVTRAEWNVCVGAWNPQLFNERWHYVQFADPIPELPAEVVLCGIGYATHYSEGLVVFVGDLWHNRITFERDPHDPMSDLWYVTVSGRTPANHVTQAYEWVCGVFGDSFEKRGPA